MRSSTVSLLAAFLPLLAAAGAQAHSSGPPHLRHRRMANAVRHITHKQDLPRALINVRDNTGHTEARKIIKKSVKKRNSQCRPRQESSTTAATATESSSQVASTTMDSWSSSAATDFGSTANAVAAWAMTNGASSNTWTSASASASSTQQAASSDTWSWSSAAAASSTSTSSSTVSVSVSGLLSITDSTCGSCDSSDDYPNGSEDWLNCGLTGSGWTPPQVAASDLITVELSSSGVFSPCADYFDQFDQYAEQYGLKGIMLAAFAMQESTCNPSATGRNGEAGLMQLASENCGGAPNGNCYDVDFNIQHAAELFSNLISSNNGNILLAVGSYNGWYKGMTESDATSASTCSAQQNLDYITQWSNGWIQGKNGYDIGSYFNLKNC